MQHSEETIFCEALERAAGPERDAYVAQACHGNAPLLGQVQSLLSAYVHSEFLEQTATLTDSLAPTRHDALTSGTVIGPYTILELIGEGGMGLVYAAEQVSPIRRQVALKLIRPGMDSREVISRFQTEQQALAMMDHPHIAKVLDAGTTPQGRPYFVMELVRGTRITHFCDQQHLSIPERLKLFLDVCAAVRHAHMRGVIHRDIKPANVLVTQQDGRPVVKVIDFGIAKALTARLSEHTLATRAGHLVGTPMYMSPEQSEFGGQPVDTRTDVYSLGILLYRLLARTTPFDAETFRTAPFEELRRIIREQEPRRPSQQASLLQADTLRGSRHATAASAAPRTTRDEVETLRGDLDWIVMKAIEKDRDRRYQSVGALEDDLFRYLHHEPVTARPPSRLYVLQKLYRRHRLSLTTAAAVLLAVLSGAALAMQQAARAVRAEQDAKQERDRLRDSEQHVRQLLYAADMRLAASSISRNDLVQFSEALDRHRPADGQLDLRSFDWYFLSAQRTSSGQTLLQTQRPLYFVCALPNRQQVAACGADGMLRIIDRQSGRELIALDAGQGELNGLAVSPDGSLLASAGDDGSVVLRDITSLQPRLRIPAHTAQAFQTAFSPDGQLLATGGNEPDARLWRVADGSPAGVLPTDGWAIESLAISCHGLLAAGTEAGQLLIADVREPQSAELIAHAPHRSTRYGINSVCFTPDGRYVVVGDRMARLTLRAVDAVQDIAWETVLADVPQAVAVSPDGTQLAAGERGGAISLFALELNDTASGREVLPQAPLARHTATWPAHEDRLQSLVFADDGRQLVSVGADGRLQQWPASRGLSQGRWADWTASTALFDCHGRLLTVDPEQGLHIRNLRAPLAGDRPLQADQDSWYHLAVADQAGLIFAARNSGHEVMRWTADGQLPEFDWSTDPSQRIGRLVASADGRRLCIELIPQDTTTLPPDTSRFLLVWDRETRQEVLRVAIKQTNDVTFSADGQSLCCEQSPDVILINLMDGGSTRTLHGHRNSIRDVTFTPDGRTVVSVAGDRTIRAWNSETGEPLWSMTGHAVGISAADITPDGRTLITVGEDRMLRCWRLETQQLTLEIPLPPGQVNRVRISPDNRTVALQYSDRRILLLEADAASATATGQALSSEATRAVADRRRPPESAATGTGSPE